MGFLSSKSKQKPQQNKENEQAVDERNGEYTININKFGYTKNEAGRAIQLTAFFHMLKLDLGGDNYAEIVTQEDEHLYMPFSFNIFEEICIVKKNKIKSWYIELDENNYMEAFFDEVRIKGSRAFYEIIKKAFEKGESFTSDIPMYYSDFSEGTDWQWNQLKNNLYNKCIKIGDSIIKNGSIMVYPKSESEIIAYNEKDFNSVPIDEVEYVVLRSNIKTDQMLMVDIERKKIMGTGFDELESLGLADEFNTSSFAQ